MRSTYTLTNDLATQRVNLYQVAVKPLPPLIRSRLSLDKLLTNNGGLTIMNLKWLLLSGGAANGRGRSSLSINFNAYNNNKQRLFIEPGEELRS